MWYECIPSMAIITVCMSMGNVVAYAVNKLYQGNVSQIKFIQKNDTALINKPQHGYVMRCFIPGQKGFSFQIKIVLNFTSNH